MTKPNISSKRASLSTTNQIYFLVLHLGQGGIEQFVATLANAFSKNYTVHIISVYRKNIPPTRPFLPEVNIEYIFDFDILEKKRQTKNFPSLLAHYVTRRRIIGKRIKQIKSGTLISTRHEHNSIIGDYANPAVYKIATEHNHLLDNPRHTRAVIQSCRKVDALILPTQELFDFYSKYVHQALCIKIAPPLANFPQKTSSLQGGQLVSVGRFAPEKDFPVMIDVFSLVLSKRPNTKLVLCGDGPERQRIIDRINLHGVQDNVVLPGFKSQSELKKILPQSSIFLVTSLTESFGLAALEAMSYGVPVVAFSSARGLSEFIENGENGFLISGCQPQDMSKQVLKILEDSALLVRLGKAARLTAKNYSLECVLPLWYKILDERPKSPCSKKDC